MAFEKGQKERPCWKCEHWGGPGPGNSGTVACVRDKAIRVIAMPQYGCAFWVRATGSDDEPDRLTEKR